MNSKQKEHENDRNTSAYGNFQRTQGPITRTPRSDAHSWSLIATFGEAKLWKDLEKHYELRGGSEEDRRQAMEWVSLFMPEIWVQE